MLSAAKHLVLRPFAEFILSEAEGLRVTHKCANLVWFDLDEEEQYGRTIRWKDCIGDRW
jgi:hypothetical protein